MACSTCGNKNTLGSGGAITGGTICVRCITFWILVGALVLGILFHRHNAAKGGAVYF